MNFINEIIGGLWGALYKFTEKRAEMIKCRSQRAGEHLLYQEVCVLTTNTVLNPNSDTCSEKRVHFRESLEAVSSTVFKFLNFSQEET